MDSIEGKRAAKQLEIDSSKTKLERNKLGQFATPRNLADSLLIYARSLTGTQPIRFFDPAFGTGSFYTACIKAYGQDNVNGLAFEIDKAYFQGAKDVWKNNTELEIINTDFTKELPPKNELPNLIVCNPPYSRHHHIPIETKQLVQQSIKQQLGFSVSGLAGLHFYFMLLAHQWLAEDGVSIWLVPSEIVEVNYGKHIREYLLNKVDLLRIHFFEHSDVQFDDALVSSCVIIFRKSAPADSKVEITVGDFNDPQEKLLVEKSCLPVDKKWSKHLLTHPYSEIATQLEVGTRLGDVFSIKRGIATGKNDFFILDKEKALSLEIPKKYLQNIIPPSRYIKGNVVELDDDGFLKTDKKLVLLNIDLPLEEIEVTYPKLYEYLQEGIAQGIDKTYLASRRKPWYSQEHRNPPAYFVKYMSREKSTKPSKSSTFIRNDSDAIATNGYLLLYEKPLDLFSVAYDAAKVSEALTKVIAESVHRFGRTYGGGLVKFEPSELREIPLSL